MKHTTITLALLLAAPAALANASPAQQAAVLSYLKSGAEPQVKDATWTSARMLKVGMLSNGKQRDGFAQYLCQELASQGVRGVSVQVVDVAQLVRTGKWVKMGEARC
jgi:hypothetical protein